MIFGSFFAAAALISYYRSWGRLWADWLTSCDHKRIGIMYIILSSLMLVKGVMDGVMIRLQQMSSVGDNFGYLEVGHFQQVFTAHGTTMIFFVGMGLMLG